MNCLAIFILDFSVIYEYKLFATKNTLKSLLNILQLFKIAKQIVNYKYILLIIAY
jgi:hypothetical protein